MNNLFVLNHKKELGLSPHALLIKEFKKLWDRDKTDNKQHAVQEFAYVYFMGDYKSEYNGYGIEKEKHIIEDVITMRRWKADEHVLAAVDKYEALQVTPSMSHLKSLRGALNSVTEYYKGLRYDNDMSDEDKIKFNPGLVAKSMSETDKMLETVLKWEEKVYGEEKEEANIKGGGRVGEFEDPDTAIWLK